MSDHGDDDSTLTEAESAIRSPFMTACFAQLKRLEASKHDHMSGFLWQRAILAWTVLQPLAWALNPYVGWSSGVISHAFYTVTMFSGLWDSNTSSIQGMVFVVIFWLVVVAVVSMVVTLLVRIGAENDRLMRWIRLFVTGMANPLYVPMQHVLMSRMVCSPAYRMETLADTASSTESDETLWLHPDTKCSESLHLVESALGAISFVLLSVTSFVVVANIYESRAEARHPLGRPNSLVDLVTWVHRTVSVVAFHFLLARGMHVAYSVVTMLMAFAMAAYYVVTMPHYSETALQCMVASFTATGWLSLFGIFHESAENGISDAVTSGVTIDRAEGSVGLLAAAIVTAVAVAAVAYSHVALWRVPRAFRLRCADVVCENPEDDTQQTGTFPKALPSNDQLLSHYPDLEGWLLEADGSVVDERLLRQLPELLTPYLDAIRLPTDVEVSSRFLLVWSEMTARRPTEKMLALTSRIYTKALLRFPQSTELNIQFAGFLIRFLERSPMAISFITGLETSAAMAQENWVNQYTVFKMANLLRTDLGIRDKSHCVALEKARKNHKEALELMLDFWMKVEMESAQQSMMRGTGTSVKADVQAVNSKGQGGLKALAALANQITDRREKAQESFRWMIQQHPQDTQILMQYASFLQQIVLDEAAHEMCIEEIERIQSKRSNKAGTQSQSQTATQAGVPTFLEQEDFAIEEANTGSRTVQDLQLTIRMAFLPLLILVLCEMTVAYLFVANHEALVEQAYESGRASYLSQKIGVTLQHLVTSINAHNSDQSTGATEPPQIVRLASKLKATARAFSSAHNSITYGKSKAMYGTMKAHLTSKKVMWADEGFEGSSVGSTQTGGAATTTTSVSGIQQGGISPLPNAATAIDLVTLWHSGNMIASKVGELLQQPTASIPTHHHTKYLLGNLWGSVSKNLHTNSYYPVESSGDGREKLQTLIIILFVVSVMGVYLIYLLFVWNFNKIATSKITTLELFWLIPSGTIRKTSEHAMEKLQDFEDKGEDEEAFMSEISEKSEENKRRSSSTKSDTIEPVEPQAAPRSRSPEDQPDDAADLSQDSSPEMQQIKAICTTRRESAVAKVLKRGVADSIDLNKLEKMQQISGLRRTSLTAAPSGGSLGSSMEGGHPPIVGPPPPPPLPPPPCVELTQESERDTRQDAATDAADVSEEDDLEQGRKIREPDGPKTNSLEELLKQQVVEFPMFYRLLSMAAIFILAVAAAVLAFLVDYDELARRQAAELAFFKHGAEYREIASGLVENARLFTQEGEPKYYVAYWDTLASRRLEELTDRLLEADISEGMAEELYAAVGVWGDLHKLHGISMLLSAQFFSDLGGLSVPDNRFPELHGVTWGGGGVLNRDSIMTGTDPPPPHASPYTFTDHAQDSSLPNKNTASVLNALATHVATTYKLTRFLLTYYLYGATEFDTDSLRVALAAWMKEAAALTTGVSNLSVSRYETMRALYAGLLADADLGRNQISVSAAALHDMVSVTVSYCAFVSNVISSTMLPQPTASVLRQSGFDSAAYAIERAEWARAQEQVWRPDRVVLHTLQHAAAFDAAGRDALAAAVAEWRTSMQALESHYYPVFPTHAASTLPRTSQNATLAAVERVLAEPDLQRARHAVRLLVQFHADPLRHGSRGGSGGGTFPAPIHDDADSALWVGFAGSILENEERPYLKLVLHMKHLIAMSAVFDDAYEALWTKLAASLKTFAHGSQEMVSSLPLFDKTRDRVRYARTAMTAVLVIIVVYTAATMYVAHWKEERRRRIALLNEEAAVLKEYRERMEGEERDAPLSPRPGDEKKEKDPKANSGNAGAPAAAASKAGSNQLKEMMLEAELLVKATQAPAYQLNATGMVTAELQRSFLLVLIAALAAISIASLQESNVGSEDVHDRQDALLVMEELRQHSVATLDKLRSLAFRFVQFRDERSLVRYLDMLAEAEVGVVAKPRFAASLVHMNDWTYYSELDQNTIDEQADITRDLFTISESARWVERVAIRMAFNSSRIAPDPTVSVDLLQRLYGGSSVVSVSNTIRNSKNLPGAVLLSTSEVPEEVDSQDWNVTALPGYAALRVEHAADFEKERVFSTRQEDLGDLMKARALLTAEEYKGYLRHIRSLPPKIAELVERSWEDKASSITRHTRDSVQRCRWASCVLLGLLVVVVLVLIVDNLGSNSHDERVAPSHEDVDSAAAAEKAEKEQSDKKDLRQHFFRFTKQCRTALCFVAVVVAALFAAIYAHSEMTADEVHTVHRATSSQYLASKALLLINRIPADHRVSVSRIQMELADLAIQMRSVRDLTHIEDSGLSHAILFESTFVLDATAASPAAASGTAAGLDPRTWKGGAPEVIQMCALGTSVYAPAPVALDARYLSFIAAVENVGGPAKTRPWKGQEAGAPSLISERQRILNQAVLINRLYDPLMEGIQAAVDDYVSASKSRGSTAMAWFAGIGFAFLLLVVLDYQFAFLPMFRQLMEEEAGTKLMLNMIPTEVRDSVPEIAQYFSTGKSDEDEKMKKLLQQSEKLLQNILPPIISRRLKAGESLIADDHAKVTVSFTALVGFDEYSKNMSARQIVGFLNDLYSTFDSLTDKLDLEKIKTIGDVYFMCGGLTDVTIEDHPVRVVETVLQFFMYLTEHNTKYHTPNITMKSGINTGPAVAGVIGSKKVAYDLWGDAVNVSSRLYSTGVNGRISVFSTTRDEVQEYFSFSERVVEAKGKGKMVTYVLESRIKPTPFSYLFDSWDQDGPHDEE